MTTLFIDFVGDSKKYISAGSAIGTTYKHFVIFCFFSEIIRVIYTIWNLLYLQYFCGIQIFKLYVNVSFFMLQFLETV